MEQTSVKCEIYLQKNEKEADNFVKYAPMLEMKIGD